MQPEKKAKMDWPEASITPLSIILLLFFFNLTLLGFIDSFIHSTNTFLNLIFGLGTILVSENILVGKTDKYSCPLGLFFYW